MKNVKTRVIGLGNPILGDDGVGWRVVEMLHQSDVNHDSDMICLSRGGLFLMEYMVGFDKVILVDSYTNPVMPHGSVSSFLLEELPQPIMHHTSSTHDSSLQTALAMGHRLEFSLPKTVFVVAITTNNVFDFSESLSPPVEKALPIACQAVIDLLNLPMKEVLNDIPRNTP